MSLVEMECEECGKKDPEWICTACLQGVCRICSDLHDCLPKDKQLAANVE